LNLVLFSSIELMYVIFVLGVWDNKDIMATIIGIVIATLSYYKIRKLFVVGDFK